MRQQWIRRNEQLLEFILEMYVISIALLFLGLNATAQRLSVSACRRHVAYMSVHVTHTHTPSQAIYTYIHRAIYVTHAHARAHTHTHTHMAYFVHYTISANGTCCQGTRYEATLLKLSSLVLFLSLPFSDIGLIYVFSCIGSEAWSFEKIFLIIYKA
jgi:hypothetical protein